jgi:tripartite-type tricarboxylate transporter receptor subunit TctC
MPPIAGDTRLEETTMAIQDLVLKAATCALALAASAGASAQGYPNKPVHVVTPFPPGGAADVVLRLVTQRLTESFKTTFVVDNKAGAGGAIGTEYVARAAPDGYTLLLTSSSTMSINPHLGPKSPYDPFTDFTPVVFIGYSPNVLVVTASAPIKSVSDLIAAAKASPGKYNFGSNGIGTLSHLTGELFKQSAGINLLHVPYKGAAPAVADTAGGQVTALFAAYASVNSMMKSGRLRALGVTSVNPIDIAPDVPTIAASGLPGFESNQWWGLYGPAGMPPEITARLNAEMNKILASPENRARFAEEAIVLGGGTPADLTAYLRADYDKWGKVIRDGNIKAE